MLKNPSSRVDIVQKYSPYQGGRRRRLVMKFIYYGKNLTLSDDLKNRAEKKIGKIGKYFNEEPEANVTFKVTKNDKIVEVTIYLDGTILRAEEAADTFEDAIDRTVDALTSQVRKQKTKLRRSQQARESIRFESFAELGPTEEKPAEEEKEIVRTKTFNLTPMYAEEAVLQMELLHHDFFVFLEGETGQVQVVYKRKDGNYGLIIPQV